MGSGGSDQRTQFLAICLFGQTAAFNDVYNLMSLGDPHPCMATPEKSHPILQIAPMQSRRERIADAMELPYVQQAAARWVRCLGRTCRTDHAVAGPDPELTPIVHRSSRDAVFSESVTHGRRCSTLGSRPSEKCGTGIDLRRQRRSRPK